MKFLSYILPSLNKKIIYTRHCTKALSESAWILFSKKYKRFIDIVTCVSQEGLEGFQQNHGWEDMPSYVIDNGVLVKPYVLPLPEEIQRDMEVYFHGMVNDR